MVDTVKARRNAAVSVVVWVASWAIARMVLGSDASQMTKVAAALLPVVPFAWFLTAFIRMVRTGDELERRIHLEALALAFPLSLLLLMVLGLLELVIPLPPKDWSFRHVWAILPLFYFTGLALARRRYQ